MGSLEYPCLHHFKPIHSSMLNFSCTFKKAPQKDELFNLGIVLISWCSCTIHHWFNLNKLIYHNFIGYPCFLVTIFISPFRRTGHNNCACSWGQWALVRHLLQLGTQSAGTFYLFYRATWNNSGDALLIPAVIMYIDGCVKYLERTTSLYLASMDTYRESLLENLMLGLISQPSWKSFLRGMLLISQLILDRI